jgi:hypothetical protein
MVTVLGQFSLNGTGVEFFVVDVIEGDNSHGDHNICVAKGTPTGEKVLRHLSVLYTNRAVDIAVSEDLISPEFRDNVHRDALFVKTGEILLQRWQERHTVKYKKV